MILIINIMADQASSNVLRRQQVVGRKCPSHQEWARIQKRVSTAEANFSTSEFGIPPQPVIRVWYWFDCSERLILTIFAFPSAQETLPPESQQSP